MLQSWLIALISLAYLGMLFAIAYYGDRRASNRPPRARPIVYSLALAVHCTSWGFFGAVGQAASFGWTSSPPLGTALLVVPSYVLPITMYLLGWRFWEKLARVGKQQKITSIADFISSRYGKSQGLAALVAIIAVIGTIPYIALQLKSVSNTYQIVSSTAVASANAPLWQDTALYVALLMALFAILFGTRKIDATEHNHGMMLAVAFESLVKLAAGLAVGAFVVWGLFDGLDDLSAQLESIKPNLRGGRPAEVSAYFTQVLLGGIVAFTLPRLFHVAVVENNTPREVLTARWLYPMYLLAFGAFVWPVAAAGLVYFGPGAVDADTYMLALPMAAGQSALALFVFIGGLSAGTSMVIVASIALSIMVCNDVVMPLLLRWQRLRLNERKDLSGLLLVIRRCAITCMLLLAYGYYQLTAGFSALASLGVLSFVAAAQFAPAVLGGLYWERASRRAAMSGILLGFGLWIYTLLIPMLAGAGLVPEHLIDGGPFGIHWLRPTALFGLEGLDTATHGVLWSLGANLACYVLGSLRDQRRLLERTQAAAFVHAPTDPLENRHVLARAASTINLGDLRVLTERFLGPARAQEIFHGYEKLVQRALSNGERAEPALVQQVERLLAAVLGASSARAVLDSALYGRRIQPEQIANIVGQASQVLQFNRELLQATFESVSQGIIVVDSEQQLIAWNQRYADMFGYPDGFLHVGKPIAEIIRYNVIRGEYGTADSTQAMSAHISAGLRPFLQNQTYSLERSRPNGTVIEVRGNPLPDGGFVTTYSDMTEHKQTEQALREAKASLELRVEERTRELTVANEALQAAKQDAEKANLSKSRYLAAASHDLLQPLNAAGLFCSALSQRLDRPASLELAEHIMSALKSAEGLLGELLDISKLDAGALKPKITEFDLSELFNELTLEFSVMAERKGLRLHAVPCRRTVRSDRQLLRRVLQNFVANAIRYTHTGRVMLGCRYHGDHLSLEVWDSGAGIPEHELKNIFEEFHRVDHHDREGEKCLGLGLAIADRIGRMLEHPIQVRSWPGKGSVFSVIVPRGQKVAVSPRPLPQPMASQLSGLRVLCVDNEPSILHGMSMLLSGWGCEVLTAKDLSEAQQALALEPWLDLMLADYRLDAGKSGVDLMDEIRVLLVEDVPGIVITADHGDAIREQAQARGYYFMNKPVKPAALRALLTRLRQAHRLNV
jgi:PAS domain S-box-containing protein